MINWHELAEDEKNRRDAFMAAYHIEHSKKKGDYHFRQADQITGSADYIPGYDDGEEKRIINLED